MSTAIFETSETTRFARLGVRVGLSENYKWI